ncbi:MAG TPA: nitrile hydratase subunit alpha [Hyphomicrobiaceae bacterium]|nr:nitrile hydratase subunit alpha [Hyphomicrobiaceae bacterium]
MHDGHDHDHSQTFQPDHDRGPATPYEVLELALRTLLLEKGILTAEEITTRMNEFDTKSPALGAKVVARAWTDPAFKARLLADTRSALEELSIDIGEVAEFKTVENTPEVHNVIVCTLCSCYPKGLLGYPPAWYKSLAYRSRTVREPRKILREFGTDIPETTDVRVHDSTADLRYIVLPMRPDGTESWSEDQLAAIITRDSMIGVTRANSPGADTSRPS